MCRLLSALHLVVHERYGSLENTLLYYWSLNQQMSEIRWNRHPQQFVSSESAWQRVYHKRNKNQQDALFTFNLFQ